MKIGIATNNPVKIRAVKNAFAAVNQKFPGLLTDNTAYENLAVPSGVADMPLSIAEMVRGARQRAVHYLRERQADWVVGLEGGVFGLENFNAGTDVMLQNWVYVFNGKEGRYGSSAAMPLPGSFRKALFEKGYELADVIDRFAGKKDIRSNEGAFGVLSEGLYNREQAFTQAVINALLPLCNTKYKE